MLDTRVATFLAVCRTLNYTHAARELNLTQSAVSQHMAHLERSYGAKLVSIEGKSMRLTEQGKLLQRAFLSFAHDEALLRRRIAAVSSDEVVRLNVGTTLTAGEYIVAPALARSLKRNPRFRVTVTSRSTEELLDLMDKGAIDCAFVEGIFEKSAFSWDLLCEQELVCVCSPEHRLAGKRCRMEDLFDEPLIVREKESGSRAVLEHALRGAKPHAGIVRRRGGGVEHRGHQGVRGCGPGRVVRLRGGRGGGARAGRSCAHRGGRRCDRARHLVRPSEGKRVRGRVQGIFRRRVRRIRRRGGVTAASARAAFHTSIRSRVRSCMPACSKGLLLIERRGRSTKRVLRRCAPLLFGCAVS